LCVVILGRVERLVSIIETLAFHISVVLLVTRRGSEHQ
jgi:hypothetical protein